MFIIVRASRVFLYGSAFGLLLFACPMVRSADNRANELIGYMDASTALLDAIDSYDLAWRTEESVEVMGMPIIPRESFLRLHYDKPNRQLLLLSVNYSYDIEQLLRGVPADRRAETLMVLIDGDRTIRRLVGRPPEVLPLSFEQRSELRTIPRLRSLGSLGFFASVFGQENNRESLVRVTSMAKTLSTKVTDLEISFTAKIESKCDETYQWFFSSQELLPIRHVVRQRCGANQNWDVVTRQTIDWSKHDGAGHLPSSVVEETLGSIRLPRKDGTKKRFPMEKTLVVDMLWRPLGSIGDIEQIAQREQITPKSIEQLIDWKRPEG
ncbi:hypothetical protein Pan14r_19460 [Crateriforma conspicua]|uniref:Uncharacterized protein n=2 Tax=Crateriforma conspicua TaxID=2527996 RepID=A0A5C5Y1M3_9PLAN|nr:hypothetical protein Mal65_34150 [Crateriforma conspicua]TWT69656.1 hypothetical protein Pan14r_19460 [Crateriforma conspicua]